jgi:hypothetical protein
MLACGYELRVATRSGDAEWRKRENPEGAEKRSDFESGVRTDVAAAGDDLATDTDTDTDTEGWRRQSERE